MQKLSEKGSKVSAQIDPNHVTEAQMKELEAISAQWEALEAKYGDAIQRYEMRWKMGGNRLETAGH